MSDSEVLIVGGGLAGLCCARRLHEAGISSRILEASDDVGGRARTDEVDGFLLDRGFQVLLTAYPEAQRVFDYSDLRLACFEPGALIRYQGRFHRFADPWRRPRHFFSTARSPVAGLLDKLRVARLRRRVCGGSLEDLFTRPETTTIDALHNAGFTERTIERFFRPFLGGVFLDRELRTYATYDLTNHATVKNWPWIVTVVDLCWGLVLSASVSCTGYLAGRWLAGS